MKIEQILFLLVLLFASLSYLSALWLGGNLLYNGIHRPAMASVRTGCNIIPDNASPSQNNGFISAGQTSYTYNATKKEYDVKIDISNPEENEPEVNDLILKHELCHVDQITRKQMKDCDSTTGKLERYILETECYVRQYFPRDLSNYTEEQYNNGISFT